MEPFRVRLNCIDHYQAVPSEFDPPLPYGYDTSRGNDRPKVPVIRVFGSTETGQKVCAHIHGAFPYLYVEYDGSLDPDEVNSAIRTLHLSIDHALAVSYHRNVYDGKTTFVAHVKFRAPVPEYLELTDLSHRWHDRSIPPECISDESTLPRQSHCSLEVDICVQDIMNRLDIKERPLHHDFVEYTNVVSPDAKLVHSMAELWQGESRRRKKRLGITDPESSPFRPDELVSMSADPRSDEKSGWIHEEDYIQKVIEIIAEERRNSDGGKISPDDFVKKTPFECEVKTALESVEDLFPQNLENWNIERAASQKKREAEKAEIQVDEKTVLSFDQADLSFYSDDEIPDQAYLVGGQDDEETTDSVDRNAGSKDGSSPREPEDTLVPDNKTSDDGGLSSFSEFESHDLHRLRQPMNSNANGLENTNGFITDTESTPRPLKRTAPGLSDEGPASKRARPLRGDAFQDCKSYSATIGSDNLPTLGVSVLHGDGTPGNIAPTAARNGTGVDSISSQSKSCEVCSTLNDEGYPSVVYQKAYYSDENDIPARQLEYAGREFRLGSNTLQYLPDFDPTGRSPAMFGEQPPVLIDRTAQEKQDHQLRTLSSSRIWEFAPVPPSRSEVIEWFEKNVAKSEKEVTPKAIQPEVKPNVLSQIEGPTQRDPHGFKYSQKKQSTSVEHQTQYMSVMSLEVHVNTRGSLAPNPEEDEISCVFWCIKSEDTDLDENGTLAGAHVGILAQPTMNGFGAKNGRVPIIDVEQEPTELDLITRLVDIVRYHDPDILTGYEVHNSSWGYLIERARRKYDYNLCDELSRVKSESHGRFGKENDRWGFTHTSTIRVTGRHMINIWRAMRSELNLLQYTMENVVFHLLHRRIPHYSFKDLTMWYQSDKPRDLAKVIDYYTSRVQMDLEILETNELIPRTSEQARLLGIDFFSVFSRGSQFKVESLMFRIAKPENFILISPSKKQVGQQNALECLPLVMEPQSDFYTSPLLVLDFQSLYPSVMIAYNYCYSTFLGRVVQWRGRNKMGFTDFKRPPRLLELLGDKVSIAPNGMIYAKPEVRKSLLARMLSEILETRVMVKGGMKLDKEDKNLQRLLNNRQLALKLIANVTYGYTSATFSGRMPCAEIADSIVQSGRETLEKAIALIHSVPRWGAEVVYGDTDSLFVYLKGRSREEAFDIGEEIAKAVTDMNPRPVKLKFEKVYHPCVLLAKKRYVGFKYEHRDQKEPEFDAKGIETVRRDGTPAEQKIEEKALKILFKTADLSQVKAYFQNQCSKIMRGKVSIQDFCFAREVRLGTYTEKGLPPGALISTKRMLEDPRLEPQYGERVPYVVVTGAPGSRLIDRCVAPEVLLQDAQMELDAEYYITKNIIPPLERIFNLVGANVRQWYDEMPKFQRIRRIEGAMSSSSASSSTIKDMNSSKKTLESYMKSSACVVCKEKLENQDTQPVCTTCLHQQPHISLLQLMSRLQRAEKRVIDLHKICRSCMGVPFGDEVKCDSKDCPVFYSRVRQMANWRSSRAVLEPVIRLLEEKGDEGLDW
ncbi:hypothetical protein VTN00DRAFT_7288 [Thermoascus crustaceus]|uniref:uncharacterized protein n=1 Tax=Thermoascus crustaceus TaxID=5088 RepID=UPI0037421604